MKLIKDLGMKDFGTYRKRRGIYECPSCMLPYETSSSDVRNGKSTKCRTCAHTAHGDFGTKLHNSWRGMRARCQQVNHKNYLDYGGSGILVQEEWNDFVLFKKWALNNGYEEGLTIDRIDNKQGYNEQNCRWATRKQQAQNQSRTIMSKFTEEEMSDAVEFYFSTDNTYDDMATMMGISKSVFNKLVGGRVNVCR